MIPIVILIVALAVVLWTAFRRLGEMSGRDVLEVAVGFLGWFVINTILWVWVINNEPGVLILNPFRLVPLLVNIPVLLVLGFWRRRIATGILAAILANAIGTLLFTAPGPILDQRFFHIIVMTPFYLSYFPPAL